MSGRLQSVLVISALMLLAACDFFVSGKALVSLTLTPVNPTIQPSKTQQFTATGTFGDLSTQDLSSQVTWTSSNTNVATISSTGLATATSSTGSTTVTATSSQNNKSATTVLTVSNRVISSIAVTPANTTLNIGQTQQFTATATFSDGATQDVTSSVTWTSSNTAVATITAGGLVTSVSAGATTITATSGTITNSTQLTVL